MNLNSFENCYFCIIQKKIFKKFGCTKPDLNPMPISLFNFSHIAGGVTRTTNEAILLCEAAGFNIIIGQELLI